MPIYVPGLTHCSECGNRLEVFGDCKICEKEREKIKQDKLNMLLSFSKEEIEALRVMSLEKAKEIRKERIKSEIKKLEKELEE